MQKKEDICLDFIFFNHYLGGGGGGSFLSAILKVGGGGGGGRLHFNPLPIFCTKFTKKDCFGWSFTFWFDILNKS